MKMQKVVCYLSVAFVLFVSWAPAVDTPQQRQRVLDIRDWGVDCSGSRDATAAVNVHTAEGAAGFDGQELQIPPGCIISVGANGSGWLIRNHANFRIRFMTSSSGSATYGFGSPVVRWCGAAAPGMAVLRLENVHSLEINDAVIDAHGHRVGSGVNASNGIIRHPSVNAALQGDSHDPNFGAFGFRRPRFPT